MQVASGPDGGSSVKEVLELWTVVHLIVFEKHDPGRRTLPEGLGFSLFSAYKLKSYWLLHKSPNPCLL